MFGAYDDMRIREYMSFFGMSQGSEYKVVEERIDQLLEMAGISDEKNLYVESLDEELKLKLGIVRTLIHDPPVVLRDDPARGLTHTARSRIQDLVSKIHDSGRTVLMCTKLLSDVLGISTRIGLINRSELIQEGTMESLIPLLHRVRAIELELDDDPAGVCGWLKDQDDVPEVYVEDGSVCFLLS